VKRLSQERSCEIDLGVVLRRNYQRRPEFRFAAYVVSILVYRALEFRRELGGCAGVVTCRPSM
jgi:hypothetical protein